MAERVHKYKLSIPHGPHEAVWAPKWRGRLEHGWMVRGKWEEFEPAVGELIASLTVQVTFRNRTAKVRKLTADFLEKHADFLQRTGSIKQKAAVTQAFDFLMPKGPRFLNTPILIHHLPVRAMVTLHTETVTGKSYSAKLVSVFFSEDRKKRTRWSVEVESTRRDRGPHMFKVIDEWRRSLMEEKLSAERFREAMAEVESRSWSYRQRKVELRYEETSSVSEFLQQLSPYGRRLLRHEMTCILEDLFRLGVILRKSQDTSKR